MLRFVQHVQNSIPGLPQTMPGAPGGGALPHEVRGLVEFFYIDWRFWAMVVPAVLAIVAFSMWWIYFKKKRMVKQIPVGFSVNVKQRSLQDLKNKRPKGDFSEPEVAKAFYFEFSGLLRLFFELCFKVPATDLTVKELETRLKLKLPITSARYQELMEFFKTADLVKFADRPTSLEEAEAFHQSMVAIAEQCMPRTHADSPRQEASQHP